jgi:hypothetical protein
MHRFRLDGQGKSDASRPRRLDLQLVIDISALDDDLKRTQFAMLGETMQYVSEK